MMRFMNEANIDKVQLTDGNFYVEATSKNGSKTCLKITEKSNGVTIIYKLIICSKSGKMIPVKNVMHRFPNYTMKSDLDKIMKYIEEEI